MAAFHTLDAGDLDAISRAWGLALAAPPQPVAAGIENSNWFVSARRDGRDCALVLTLVQAVPAGELDFFLDLAATLSAAGLPVPAALPTRDGARWLRLQGLPALLLPRLPGAHARVPVPAQAEAAGAMLARFHLAAAACPSRRHARDCDWWPQALAQLPAGACDAGERAMLSGALAAASRLFAQAGALPRGIVHGDYFRDNLLLEGTRVSGVLDLFHATGDLLAWDVGIALNDWSLAAEDGEDAALAAAFLAGYAAVRPLQDGERALLQGLRAAAAARFWLSRLVAAARPAEAGQVGGRKDPAPMRRLWQRLAG